jgi:hypothetical protein
VVAGEEEEEEEAEQPTPEPEEEEEEEDAMLRMIAEPFQAEEEGLDFEEFCEVRPRWRSHRRAAPPLVRLTPDSRRQPAPLYTCF